MIREGFKKVYQTSDEDGIILAEFFNPNTKQGYSDFVMDARLGIFDEDIYRTHEAHKAWRNARRDLRVGDRVVVSRGKKVSLGLVATIVEMYTWKDEKGRPRTRYAVLSNGKRVVAWNLDLI